MNRHIDFDTGSALFQMADEYERLVANPPDPEEEGLSKRQKVAAVTNRGAMKLSQLERGADPADSLGGVSFRHLSMLAQIKSSDEDVWTSMRASGHLTGEPNDSLSQRLTRMRNWIGSIHFPEDARIQIHKTISEEARAELSEEQRVFLSSLVEELAESDWSEQAIGTTIREVAPTCGIGGREAYIALYWALLGRNHGPKASALLFEIGRESVIALLTS